MYFMRQQCLFPENSNLPYSLLLPVKKYSWSVNEQGQSHLPAVLWNDAWRQKDSLQTKRSQVECIPSGLYNGKQANSLKDLFSEHSHPHLETYRQTLAQK